MPPTTTGGYQPTPANPVTGLAILSNGRGGYVADTSGVLHPFGIGVHAPPPPATLRRPLAVPAAGVSFVAPRTR
jgi:hypothetical protein